LLAGAAQGLTAVRCIYLDELREFDAEHAWSVALAIFVSCGAEPARVSYTQDGDDGRSVKPATFTRRLDGLRADSVSVASAAIDEISQIYVAPTYVGVDLGAGRSALFFYSDNLPNHSLTHWAESDLLQSVGYSAAYAFDYALPFSPSAYFWGLGYAPNLRKFGEITSTDGARLECWRDNQRRGLRPSDGYMRDLYQQNLLSEVHLSKEVEGMPLAEWIQERDAGKLEPVGSRWLWSLEPEEIHRCRFVLNQAGFLLSGRPLHTDT
jgi:hypothetical protein